MTEPVSMERIHSAGVDVSQIAEASVLIKVDEASAPLSRQHPLFGLCRGLTALGFSRVEVCGAADYFDALDKLEQDAPCVQQYPTAWVSESIAAQAPPADVIIDLSNDPVSESYCHQLSRSRSCPCISVAWGRTWAIVSPKPVTAGPSAKPCFPAPSERDALPPVGRIATGLALQEVLMLVGKVQSVALLEGPVMYAAARDSSAGSVQRQWLTESIENVVCDIIGAGAIGVHLLETLAAMLGEGCRLRVFDPDIVESVNLPSQTIYSKEDIGRFKVTAVAEKVQNLSRPGVGIEPYAVTYQNRPQSLSKASVRIIAADNWAVRKYVNDLSLADGVPITEAGSSPLAAQQRTYLPGQTACLACRIPDLAEKAAMEEAPNSCSESPALTLPGTVCIAGGILATETIKALRPEQFHSPSQGTITYDARFPQRFGIVDQQPACRH